MSFPAYGLRVFHRHGARAGSDAAPSPPGPASPRPGTATARLAILLAWMLPTAAAQAAEGAPPPYAADAARGDSLIRAGKSSEALAPLLAAHAAGMPADSLYWLLAEAARRNGAIDTAMGFNLAAGTPAPGPFRDSVLSQRRRLYLAAGLARDAAALRDSLPPALREDRKRAKRLTARAGTGWFGEENRPAHAPPFGSAFPEYDPSGAEYRLGAGFEVPLVRSGSAEWIAGMETQAAKSYAKDSLDSRLGISLREEGWLLPGLSLGAGAGTGRVTGSGWIASCKGEAYWLSLGADGFSMIAAGIESEWDGEGRERFQTAWLAWHRDAARDGRGFSFSAGLNGFRSAPIVVSSAESLIYVDDARRADPIHYTDSTYDSAIAAGRFNRYQLYTDPRHRGVRSVSSRAPQSFVAFSPQAAYSHPLPGKIEAELSLSFSGSWFPEAYRRDQAPLPSSIPADAGFTGLARSRADGRDYAAVLSPENGRLEAYGAAPLEREARTRLEGRAGAQLSLRRAFGALGTLALAANARRYASNLADAAPIWIPEWDAGVSLNWNGAWEW